MKIIDGHRVHADADSREELDSVAESVESMGICPEIRKKVTRAKSSRPPSSWLNFSKSVCAAGAYKKKGHKKYFDCIKKEASPAWKNMGQPEKDTWKTSQISNGREFTKPSPEEVIDIDVI